MERHQIIEMMRELKLVGMRAAFDEREMVFSDLRAREDRHLNLNNFNPLRAGGQANRLFPVAKIGSESPFPGNFQRQNALPKPTADAQVVDI